jgi:uncharacterized membrane protein
MGLQLNNWKAVGYIFLGFGSVFLSYALIAFLALISLNPTPLDITPAALAANTPWFILAALAYVVGIVGYFAGKENKLKETGKPASRRVSFEMDSMWSIPIGAFVVLTVLLLQFGLGYWNDSDLIFGVAFPILYSVVAGLIIGLVALLLIDRINKS